MTRAAISFAIILTTVSVFAFGEQPEPNQTADHVSRVKARLQFISEVNAAGSAYKRDLDTLGKVAADNADVKSFESLKRAKANFEARGILSNIPVAAKAKKSYHVAVDVAINNLSLRYKKLISSNLVAQQVKEAKIVESELSFIKDALRSPKPSPSNMAYQATIVLLNGRTMTGRLVSRTTDSYIIKSSGQNTEATIPKSEIKSARIVAVDAGEAGLLVTSQLTGDAQQMLKRLAEDCRISSSAVYIRYRDKDISDVLVNLKTGDAFVEKEDDEGEFEEVEGEGRRDIRWEGLTPMPAEDLLKFIQKEDIDVPIYVSQNRIVGQRKVPDGRDARGRSVYRIVDVKKRKWSKKSHAFNRHLEQSKRLAEAKRQQSGPKTGHVKVAPFDDPPFLSMLKRVQRNRQ